MTAHKLRMAALAAQTRRTLKHTTNPAERAVMLIIITRVIADHAAAALTAKGDGDTTELNGAERVLAAAVEHLHRTTFDRIPAAEHE